MTKIQTFHLLHSHCINYLLPGFLSFARTSDC